MSEMIVSASSCVNTAVLRHSGSALPPAVNIWITPPDELPYSAENGPRSTSMRSAAASGKFDTWPCPSGIVAGIPST